MSDAVSEVKRWEITLDPDSRIHVHYATTSSEVINDGFKGLARELREIADQFEALAQGISRRKK